MVDVGDDGNVAKVVSGGQSGSVCKEDEWWAKGRNGPAHRLSSLVAGRTGAILGPGLPGSGVPLDGRRPAVPFEFALDVIPGQRFGVAPLFFILARSGQDYRGHGPKDQNG